ncbi:MAG TPA: cytochrome c3 family protein [Anaerolineales bacterium]
MIQRLFPPASPPPPGGPSHHWRWLGLIATLVLVAIPFALASADGGPQPRFQETDNNSCLACHASPDLHTELPSGQILDLTVFPGAFENSVHGMAAIGCVDCHTEIDGYPHPAYEGNTRRGYTVFHYQTCRGCHEDKYEASLDSVHQQALASGDFNAAVCTDCHGVHNIRPAGEPRSQIPQTCRQCHTTIFDRYAESVHGNALLGEGNPDVPSCVDCHGVHDTEGPSTNAQFRLFSPQLCAECHADEELMTKYDISTDVFDTYVTDFHGTTVTLFQQVAPDQVTNKPVCIDCHGVHDIASASDPDSPVIRENLVLTCQKCHPSASPNFPSAWLSHYRPSPDHWPLVYFVDLFYKFFIPGVLGGMAVFVVSDAGRRLIERRRQRQNADE